MLWALSDSVSASSPRTCATLPVREVGGSRGNDPLRSSCLLVTFQASLFARWAQYLWKALANHNTCTSKPLTSGT